MLQLKQGCLGFGRHEIDTTVSAYWEYNTKVLIASYDTSLLLNQSFSKTTLWTESIKNSYQDNQTYIWIYIIHVHE